LLAAVEDVAVAGRPVVDTDELASRVASLRAHLPDVG
jgi:hypothetical protein